MHLVPWISRVVPVVLRRVGQGLGFLMRKVVRVLITQILKIPLAEAPDLGPALPVVLSGRRVGIRPQCNRFFAFLNKRGRRDLEPDTTVLLPQPLPVGDDVKHAAL